MLNVELEEFNLNDKEGIIALVNCQTKQAALIYKTDFRIFNSFQSDEESSLAVIYIRYLIDSCQKIFIVPSSYFVLNSDEDNPFCVEIP